jgi:branched-chain amino acid transport system substrate-binding protein
VRRFLALLVLPAALGCSQDVRIGCVISASGAAASYGDEVRKGIELALEVETESGDLPGPVSLVFRDDATNPEVGVRAFEELASRERVPFVIGAVSSPVTLALGRACERRGIVLLSPTASAPEISEAGDWVFRIHPADGVEAVSMAEFARDQGLRRVAVIGVEDRTGLRLRDTFADRIAEVRLELAGVAMFHEGNEEELERAVLAIAALSPEAVYMAAYPREAAQIARRLHELGVGARLLGTSALGEEFLRSAGPAGDGAVFPGSTFEVDDDDPAVSLFVERYRERYGEDPDSWAAHGYDALRIALRAFRDAPRFRPEALRDALAAIGDFDGAAGPTAFDANGDVMRYPRLRVVRRQEIVPYDRVVAEGGILAPPGR